MKYFTLRYSVLYVVLFALAITCAWAQTGNIRGSVKTADGQPAEYINIAVKGLNKGATSNAKGEFEIRKVQAGPHVLLISFVGLEPQQVDIEVKANETTQVPEITLHENEKELNEVVVTSTRGYKEDAVSPSLRLKTPILEAPQNIQVISKQLLNDQQVFDMLEGVTRNVSGATKLEHWDNYAYINMRGSQVTAFRNGMNVQMPWGPLAEDMSMVERIEFVKGPAGFMLASGEPSGFYNVVTKKPTGVNKGSVQLTLGSFETYRTALDLDGKLTKDGKLLYRINVMGQLKGSHRDFETNNRYSIVPVIKYLFDDNTSLTVEYTHQFSQMSAIGSNYAFSANGYGDLPRNFTTAEPNLDPTNINDRNVLAIFQHRLNERWNFTGQLAYYNYKQVGQSLWPSSVSPEGNMQRGASIWDALGLSKIGQFFVNGEERTGNITHRILAGLDLSNKDYYADWSQGGALGGDTFNIYKPVYGLVPASALPTYDRSKSIRERGVHYNQSTTGIYVQDEMAFLENKVRLTLAGRYTNAKNADPYSESTDDNKFTPRVGVSISLTPNTTVYGVYDQAFLPNPGHDYTGKKFDPITGSNLEAGVKRDWMNGKWNAGLTAYQITKNNVLVLDTDHPDPTTGQLVYSKQIGQTQTKGIEFDVRGEVVRNLELVLNYALTDSKVTKDTQEQNIGTKVPGTSKHLTNAWLNYRFSNGALKGLGFSAGYQWQVERSSWYVFDGTNQSLPNYFRLDGAVSWQNESFSVGLNVNNILDAYLFSGSPYDLNFDGKKEFYWQTEAPINFRLNVAYRF
jgi:iron complex outermembrane receptor protein